MKILFWVPYPKEGASNRYRVEQYLPYLKNNGIKYSLHHFWSHSAYKILYKNGHYFKKVFSFIAGAISRIIDLILIIRYDVIFIHREAYPVGGAFLETFISLIKKPIIYDFDDAVFLPVSSHQNKFIGIFKNPAKVSHIIKISSHVIAGNRYLADYALRYNCSVTIIPTPIDTEKRSSRVVKINSEKIIVGWMGSITTLEFLNVIKKPFIYLSERFPNVIFKIVGGEFFINGYPNVISKPWSMEQEAEDLMTFDIGIMPMPDNDWTKGKCGFKAILYMNMGIPCVCSPVGMNKEIVGDGLNGFFASTEDEWIAKLSLLIKNSDLRKELGAAGRKTVEERYSVNINAPKFLDVLKGVYEQSKG